MPKQPINENLQLVNEHKKKIHYRKSPSILQFCWDHKTLEQFAEHIIAGEHTDKNPALPDCLALYDIPFTMEEYDMDGRQVSYANKKLGLTIEVNHANRYKNMRDLNSIEIYPSFGWRNDITYLQ